MAIRLLADGRSVRLIGVNAPELAHHGRPAEPLAQQAQRRLAELLRDSGQRVRLVNGQQARDHYGRVLAHAFDARGRNLEEQLLAEGLGFKGGVVGCHLVFRIRNPQAV